MARTDERLDDLANRVDAGFERVDVEIRELKGDIARLDAKLDGKIENLDAKFDAKFDRLDSKIDGLHRVMVQSNVAMIVTLIGVIGGLIGANATGLIGG